MHKWFFAVTFTLLLTLVRLAYGQGTVYEGLDVLFLVDQSGSMGGRAFGHDNAPTDPLGLRFQAVQYALQTLSEYRRVVPSETVFRMGVISFGDTTEVALPWTTISDDTANLEPLVEQLSAASFGARNLGNTNFLAAYREAERQFASLPVNERHLRVIVVLTDGAPCAPAEFVDRTCSTPADQIQHMEFLTGLASTAFPAPNYALYAIAIDSGNTYWGRFASYWERVVREAGNAQRVETPNEVGQQFLEILAKVVAKLRPDEADAATGDVIGRLVGIENQSGVIDVPPYYQSMRVTVFKTDPVASIVLTDPSGTTLNEASPQVSVTGVNGAIETWTINSPEPGRWRIVTALDASLLDIYLDLIRVTYAIEVPSTAFTRYIAFPVTLRIFDSDGDPLPVYDDPRYHLNVQATLQLPSGVTRQFELALSGQNIYIGELLPEEVGAYTLSLTATTTNIDGSRVTIIDAPDAVTFDVLPLRLRAMQQPTGGILISETVQLSAQLLNDVNVQASDNFIVSAMVRGGEDDLSYQLSPDAEGNYTAEIVMDDPGQFQIVVQAKRRLPDNSEVLIDEVVLPLFRVNPADFIGLRIVSPVANETQFTTVGVPPITPNELTVEVVATGEDGTTRALESLTPEGNIPLTLRVIDEQGQEVTGATALVSVEGGVYQAIIPGLGTGTFQVEVLADVTQRLGGSTLFDPRTIRQSLTVMRQTNPAFIAMVVLLAASGVAVVAGTGYFTVRSFRLRQHPATGRLVLFSEDYSQAGFGRSQVWSYSLDRARKNYIVIPRPPAGLKRIIVECPNDSMARQKQVHITVEAGGKKILNRQVFRPGTERRLDAISNENLAYTLAKDPDFSDV